MDFLEIIVIEALINKKYYRECYRYKVLATLLILKNVFRDTQQKITDLFPEKTVSKEILDKWIKNQLHKEFINTLYDLMPKSLSDIENFTENKLVKYRTFFNSSAKVFTLNYDPLLYWMLMRFINYGNKDYVDCLDLSEQLENSDKNSKEYKNLTNKLEKSKNKCLKAIRAEMYEVYLQDKDYYKMSISFKDKVLLEKDINEAQKKFLIKWDKLAKGLYNALEENKASNDVFKEESTSLDNITTSALETKIKTVEQNKEDLKVKIDGGFNKEIWIEDSEQTIFYLHGSFHFMENEENVVKVKADDSNKMVDKIKEALDKGYEPLTVLESSPEEKIKRIEKSKKDIEYNISLERFKSDAPDVTKDALIFYLEQFKKGDVTDKDYQRQIIDTFINSIILNEDTIIIAYNYSDSNNGTRELAIKNTFDKFECDELFGG